MSAARSPADASRLTFLPADVITAMQISTIHRRSQKIFNEALRPLGFEERHFAVLAVLDGRGPLTQRQLAHLLDLDKSALGRIVDDLERQRLAERRAVPTDRRAHTIHLTDLGRQRIDEAQRIAGNVGRQLFAHLPPSTRRAFDQALRQLLDGAEADPSSPTKEGQP
ncbi:MarR family winged helix-turn-helix transcriptional regulator [Micromonospora sp. NPDC048898]|uniref:MarR family winged helix-turn-helix transcriptional regulator n=1 Tax=Micromonospora sp. NPDC048898 TaxID=3364260 RepID=UPI0037101F56